MKKETLLVLLDNLFDDKVEQLKAEFTPIKGERGLRGLPGKPFDFGEHKDDIFSEIKSYIDETKENYKLKFEELTDEEVESLKVKIEDVELLLNYYLDSRIEDIRLRFSDLTNEEKNSLKVRGPRGQKGKQGPAGKGFVFEEHAEKIEKLLPKEEDLKLRFSDLTEEEKESLKVQGPKGQRGPKGNPGKNLIFDEHVEEIQKLLPKTEDLKLYFTDLSEEDKDEIRLKFQDLTDKEKDSLKLKFEDLTDEEKNTLKIRGPRGQRGKSIKGEDGATWLTAKDPNANPGDLFLDRSTCEVYRFDKEWKFLVNLKGEKGIRGLPGVTGLTGPKGAKGIDGGDAPKVIDIDLRKIGENEIYFIFYFDDGSKIETDRIDLPDVAQTVNIMNTFAASGGVNAEVAKRLQITRIADERIEIGEFVTATSGTNVALAQSNVEAKADVLGMAITAGDATDEILILLFGNNEDASYAYALNVPLYLALDGLVSTSLPGSGWITRVATSNGTGSIFIKVEEPIEI